MKNAMRREEFRCELYPTIVTPFTNDGAIDYASLEKLLHMFGQLEMDGVFAVCQSSEMFFLSETEKIELAAFSINQCKKEGMRCVVSGHTQDSLDQQISYLKMLEALKPDAIILVTNRLASQDDSDETLLANIEVIRSSLHPDTCLGLYECPYPYKRLLSIFVLDRIREMGNFEFIKDTCCDSDVISERLLVLRGSKLRLYNANAATLMSSLADGAAGYSGVMLNCMPEMFGLLRDSMPIRPLPQDIFGGLHARIAGFLTMASMMEYQKYPSNAKYWLVKKGIFSTTKTRTEKVELTSSQRLEIDALSQEYFYKLSSLSHRAESILLFEEGTYFPSCHASSVLHASNGDLLCAYFAGSYESADDVCIWLSHQINNVWQEPRLIAKVMDEAHWNPVLFETIEGIRIVFKVGKEICNWKSYTMLSQDGGKSFSSPTIYNEPNSAGGPVRTKPIRIGASILAPNSDETMDTWTVRIDRSEDEGASFSRIADIPLNLTSTKKKNFIVGKGAIQPTLWADPAGNVHAFLRTTCGKIFRSDSTDQGKSWSEAYDTGLPNNNSGIDTVMWNETLYLVFNPTYENRAPRTPLVVWSSCDNGLTFKPFVTLQDLPIDYSGHPSEFSYPAMIAWDGWLHITYTYNRKQIAYSKIQLD